MPPRGSSSNSRKHGAKQRAAAPQLPLDSAPKGRKTACRRRAAALQLPPELVKEIIDLSCHSAHDVVPWLLSCRSYKALALRTPAYSQFIVWPPKGCKIKEPSWLGLRAMLTSCSPTKTLELRLLFEESSLEYIHRVADLVRTLALPKASYVRIRFSMCFGRDMPPPHISIFLAGPAPNLVSFEIGAVGAYRPLVHEQPQDELFGGLAPKLRNVWFTNFPIPMYRIGAFDNVQELSVYSPRGGFMSERSSDTFLGGCSNVRALHLSYVVGFDSTEEPFTRQELQDRVAALTELDIDVTFQGQAAIDALNYFGNEQMWAIRAVGVGDNEEEGFPDGFVPALIRTLPELEVDPIHLFVRRSGDAYRFKFCSSTSQSGMGRYFILNRHTFHGRTSPWRAQAANLAKALEGASNILGRVTHLTCAMRSLPALAAFSVSRSGFSALTLLSVSVEDAEIELNEGHRRFYASSVGTVNLLVPRSHQHLFEEGENLRSRVFQILHSWVKVPRSAVTVIASQQN